MKMQTQPLEGSSLRTRAAQGARNSNAKLRARFGAATGPLPKVAETVREVSAQLDSLMSKTIAAAGCKDAAAFAKLPREERDAFLAQARGQSRPEVRGAEEQSRPVPLAQIVRSQTNREHFDPEKMAELVESIRTHGVMEPIIVRPVKAGEWFVEPVISHTAKGPVDRFEVLSRGWVRHITMRKAGEPPGFWSSYLPPKFDTEAEATAALPQYEIVMGERRWRAAQEAKLATIPAIVRAIDDRTALEWQLTENLQREDLRPLDEARGYQQLIDMGYKIEELVTKLHRSKSGIYGRLKLLELPEEAKAAVEAGTLPASHAELIARIDDPAAQAKLAKQILTPQKDWRDGKVFEETMSFRDAKAAADEAAAALAKEKKWEEQTAEYRAEGLKVLTIAQSGKVFRYGSLAAGYVGANDKCELDTQGRTWKALLSKVGQEGSAMVAQNSWSSGGNAVRMVFARKGAETALKEGGLLSAKAQPMSPEEKRKREEEKQARAAAERFAKDSAAIGQIVTTVESRDLSADALRFIAAALLEARVWNLLGMAKRRATEKEDDFERSNGYATIRRNLGKVLAEADGRRLRGILIEMLLWQGNRADEPLLKKAQALFGGKVQTPGKGKK